MTYNPAAGGGISDGDKGDITVSASGATWLIDNAVVETANLGGDITAAGIALLNDATAADQRTTLGLGTAATSAVGDFDAAGTASGAVSTHAALTTGVHGITAFGADLVDSADAAAARTALALGTLATQSGTFSGTSSGTNTGDNAVNSLYSGLVSNATHTGEVTGSGALTIANDAVTYAKMQNAAAGNVVLARAAATSGDFSEVAVGASQLLGRGSTGDVAAITLGSGLSMSGTTVSASGGSSPVVYVAAGADTSIASVTDVTVVTRDVTSVGTTDTLVVESEFTILNASGAARVYVVTLDFDGLFDIELTTGSLAVTLGHFFNMRAVLDVRSASLAYATVTLEGGLITGLASGADTTTVATHLRTRGWGTTASDASGTTTVTLRIRSALGTASQTCRLHNLTISKYTPT